MLQKKIENSKWNDRRYCETCGKWVATWVKIGIFDEFIPRPAMYLPVDTSRVGLYCKNCSA